MKKFVSVAKSFRANVLLSSSAAALLMAASPNLLAAVTPATAINYYVAPSGNDSNSGSQAAPFKTLARAAQAATQPGTTVWVAPGTYEGSIKTAGSGTASNRIYWVSTTKWGAKIVPPTSGATDTAWDNRGSYVSIIGFEIDGTNFAKWTHGFYTGGSYTMIQDNHVHHIAKTSVCTSSGGSAIGVHPGHLRVDIGQREEQRRVPRRRSGHPPVARRHPCDRDQQHRERLALRHHCRRWRLLPQYHRQRLHGGEQ
jgi:hypothetical protein